ncbi:hypothetical protein EJ06DRAFT_95009 [Trichodelitschia bisporula]|uniref:Uncharacterized protein n=1 Tax=Trichodelitschia bisporula TaxID=703511 RepID=A0A6G1HT50_9PEZI|nr:hypothetical protein EJ06DRAFT_95009 [Trichodelitschia bisporula]
MDALAVPGRGNNIKAGPHFPTRKMFVRKQHRKRPQLQRKRALHITPRKNHTPLPPPRPRTSGSNLTPFSNTSRTTNQPTSAKLPQSEFPQQDIKPKIPS